MVTRPPRVQPQAPPEVKKLKICVLGDSTVGKSAFCRQFAEQGYPENYEATVGSDFYSKNLGTAHGLFQFNLWDLSGDAVYSEVRNEFFKESQAIIMMYDIGRRKSFENLDMVWLKEIRISGGDSLPVYVVGNKSDLDDRRQVPKSEAEKWTMNTKQFTGYYETSAKDNTGFLRIFREMAENNA